MRVCLGRGQIPAALLDVGAKRGDGHDRECGAPFPRAGEDLVRSPNCGVDLVGERERGEGEDRPVSLAVKLEREVGRECALGEVGRPGRGAQVHDLVHRHDGERRDLELGRRRSAGILQTRDRRIGFAPRRRRADASPQQRKLDLLPCRLVGWDPVLGAAQDRSPLRSPSREEEHAAELDRGAGDICRLLTGLDDLGERGDRSRIADARPRQAELE